MSNFKKRVLELVVEEINEKPDLQIQYENLSKVEQLWYLRLQSIIKEAKLSKNLQISDEPKGVEGLNQNQLERIVRNKAFKSDYNHLISATSLATQSDKAWDFEMIDHLKKTLLSLRSVQLGIIQNIKANLIVCYQLFYKYSLF